jgi:hypothetical protein
MSTNPFNRWSWGGLLLGLCLAAGLIISAAQVTRAWLHIADSQVISVTGSAHQDVTSDLAVWTAAFSAEGDQLAEAQQKLKADAARVMDFFQQRGMMTTARRWVTGCGRRCGWSPATWRGWWNCNSNPAVW